MREGMERLVHLPFKLGISESSIAIGVQQQPKRTKEEEEEEEEEEDSLASGENMKNSFRSPGLLRSNISVGIHRLFMQGFKTFSRLFVYYKGMKWKKKKWKWIRKQGVLQATDVKHATQIGLDGSASAATADPIMKGTWDNLI
ncbi:hypothetical protein M0R45_025361 [Rubus argutus]|uniref:Uncharacterized protein n=1 Tax=Rubus argutus TaxID=59490 RepID=A0AAW1WY00_RUBAR